MVFNPNPDSSSTTAVAWFCAVCGAGPLVSAWWDDEGRQLVCLSCCTKILERRAKLLGARAVLEGRPASTGLVQLDQPGGDARLLRRHEA